MKTITLPWLLFALLLAPTIGSAQSSSVPEPDGNDCTVTGSNGNNFIQSAPCQNQTMMQDLYFVAGLHHHDATRFTDLRGKTVYLGANTNITFSAGTLTDANTRFYADNTSAHLLVKGGDGQSSKPYDAQPDNPNANQNANKNSLDYLNSQLALCQGVCTLGLPNTIEPVAPVTLLSWTTKVAGSTVVLNWATSEEEDNSHFAVLRSTDGNSFTTIATISGRGTTGVMSTYSLRDASPGATTTYYRLEQYDYDGTKTDLGVQSVRMTGSDAPALRVSPNPVASGQRMTVGSKVADNTAVQIVGPNGSLVGTFLVQGQAFRVPELTPGVYTLRLNGETARFVVAR